MSQNPNSASKHKLLQLVLLALLFLIPPAVAYILFFTDFKPSSSVNYGELVQPPTPLLDAELETLAGEKFKISDLQRNWVLLYVGSSRCDEVCDGSLHKINRVRLAQGEQMRRVKSVYIVPADTPVSEVDRVVQAHRGILILRAGPQVLEALLTQLENGSETALQNFRRVYIVDPLGNVMMLYHAEADPSGMRKDLKRLLKISQIG